MDKENKIIFASSVLNPLKEEKKEELDYTYTTTGKIVPSIDEEKKKNGMEIDSIYDDEKSDIYY